ncbi:hypothetical protein GGS21DRAFT_527323 [Xylaria nigripes]|nr:hypothetical protein GGS21DRAFT_527323 [Xylaria nigripes]
MAEPNQPPTHPAHYLMPTENESDGLSSESLVIDNPVAITNEPITPTEISRSDDSGTSTTLFHESLNPESHSEVLSRFMPTPSASTSIGQQSRQSVDSNVPGLDVSSPVEGQDAATVIPGNSDSNSPISTSTQAPIRSSIASTEVADVPTADDDEHADLELADSTPITPLPIRESLGISGIASLVVGHIGMLAVLLFLAFLWFGHGSTPEASNAIGLWRQIVLSNWMTRSITLGSLVIRILATLQATVCTSMIAARILERRSARKSFVPWFSVIRSINDGPLRLVQMLLTSKSLAVVRYPEFWLAALMLLITFALQFSSTILLSDLQNFTIIGDHRQIQVPSLLYYNADDFIFQIRSPLYLLKRPTYSTFGEVQRKSNSTPNSYGMSDTGLIQRGFLPFSNEQNRTSVRKYDGNAMVLNSRAACMRPVIQGKYGVLSDNDPSNIGWGGFYTGELHYDSSLDEAHANWTSSCLPGECGTVPYNCMVPGSTSGQYETFVCGLSRPGQNPVMWTFHPLWTPTDMPWAVNTSAFLVMSSNMRDDDWHQITDAQSLPQGEPHDEWQSFEMIPGRFVNMTLCFLGTTLERKFVTMNSSGNLREPEVPGAEISKKYNTTDVRTLYGFDGSRKSAAERGILDMTIIDGPRDGPASGPAYKTLSYADADNITTAQFTSALLDIVLYDQATLVISTNQTIAFCRFCYAVSESTVDLQLALLLSDIIGESKRAADALVTYVTVIGVAVYYDYFKSLVTPQESGVTMTTDVQIPGQCSKYGCRGFIPVTILIVIHLLYVTVIAVLYARQAQYSRYGNVWHTASQLIPGELRGSWEKSNNASDSAVIDVFREERTDDFLKLGRLDDGQIGMLKETVDVKPESKLGSAESRKPARLTWLKTKLRRKDGENKRNNDSA